MLLPTILIVFVAALLPSGVNADREVPPFDYAIFTKDKKHVFVMLVPPEETTQLEGASREGPPHYHTVIFNSDDSFEKGEEQEPDSLRVQYPCSGLYRNNGSSTPIWTVDWYSHSVYLFPDGEHLIRWGLWNFTEYENGEPSFNGLAFAFYKNGLEITQYKVKDVVKDTNAIRFTISHYFWLKNKHIDKSSGLLYVETLDNQEYIYYVREMGASITGRESACKSNSKYGPKIESNLPVIIAAVILIGILGTMILRFRKRAKLNTSIQN